MSVIQEIGVWANEQADWVSDAVRRVFVQGTLSATDVADMATLVKIELGIEDPKKCIAKRLDIATLPAAKQAGFDVSLTAIRAPKNINAIGALEGVTFEADGLTIVYGQNGAGKSGYVRALKKACRARNSEAIIPNVFVPPDLPSPAQACFAWRAGEKQDVCDWIDGASPPTPLSKIAVFDSHCARVFVDNQSKVSYIPYGMDVLLELATGQKAAQKLLEAERLGARFDMTKFAALNGETAVGRMWASLSRTTDPKAVEDLGKLSEDEENELNFLVKLFRDEDPAKQATSLRRFAARIQAVENELEQLKAPLLDERTELLRTAFEQLITAETASKLAATELQESGMALSGTGTDPWEILVRSAIKFATEKVYLGQSFPGPAEGANCVLCQQPLSPEASERLTKFVKFLEADAQKLFTEKRRVAAELYKSITNANIDAFPSDHVFFEELTEIAAEITASTGAYLAGLRARQAEVKAMVPNRRLDELTSLPSSPSAALKVLRENKTALADELDKVLMPEQRKLKAARLVELEARVKLKVLLPTVLEAIVFLKRQHDFSEAVKRCNTAALTRKITELYEKTVTAELRAALERELKDFGLGTIKINLEMSGQKGARMQQLKLSAPGQFSRVKLSDILSEGEQRAIALASFLAEIGLEQGLSGIVFDDPVSSLDHVRREQIASRLAFEAKTRQVIIFTHDLAFAWSLRDFAARHGAKHIERHVFAAGDSKGHCGASLPFEAKKLDARINDLRILAASAKNVLDENHDYLSYNTMVRTGYRQMRDTWELLVEDLLFAGTVKRFRRSVDTKKLRYVVVEDDDVKSVYEGMTRCSNFTHEGGAEAPPPLPRPDEFLADVERLGTAVSIIKARKKGVEERRAKAGVAA